MANPPRDGDQQYELGPSFTDDELEGAQASELPSWLRNLADSLDTDPDEPAGAEQAASSTTHMPEANAPGAAPRQSNADEFNDAADWLAEPQSPAIGAEGRGAVGAGFFSEDDLPEWLRALNSEQDGPSLDFPDDDDIEQPVAAAAAASGPARAITVPAVSNVWVTGMEARSEQPGATLFSMIVASGDNRPEVPVVAASRTASAGGATRAAAASAAMTKDTPSEASKRRSQWTTRERILLVAVIVMTIILILMLSGNLGS